MSIRKATNMGTVIAELAGERGEENNPELSPLPPLFYFKTAGVMMGMFRKLNRSSRSRSPLTM